MHAWSTFARIPQLHTGFFEHKAAFQTGSRFQNENHCLNLPPCPSSNLSGSLNEAGTALQANKKKLYCYFCFSSKLKDKKITSHFVRRLQRTPSHRLFLASDALNKCFLQKFEEYYFINSACLLYQQHQGSCCELVLQISATICECFQSVRPSV